jgi:medium-chain acyl-[acyl-carrier-protein] hydrolase
MTPWLIYPQIGMVQKGNNSTVSLSSSAPKFRLFCFPYSGAGASIFRPWAAPLAPDIEVIAIQPPGRESRLQEPLLNELPSLTEALTPALIPYLDRPFAFFGHSVGALICFEVARQLRRFELPTPFHLVVSARHAPQLPAPTPPIHQLADTDFITELRRYNGTPEMVLQNTELMNFFIPILRADLAINETYIYTPEAPFEFPISAFGGLQDSQVDEDDLAAWAEQTQSEFSLQMLPGDHFFLKDQQEKILQSIAALESLL